MLKKELCIYAGHLGFRGGKFVVAASALLDVVKNMNIREIQQKYNNSIRYVQQNSNTAEDHFEQDPEQT